MKSLFIFASILVWVNQAPNLPIVDLQKPPYIISAEALAGVRIASEDLQRWKEFPLSMRKLENYDVRIRAEKPHVILDMIPRMKADERLKSGGVTSLGVNVRYTVDIGTRKIIARQRFQ